MCGVDSVAERAADRLWTEYTPLTDDLLSSQHSTTLHLLVQSVLIRTQLCIVQVHTVLIVAVFLLEK